MNANGLVAAASMTSHTEIPSRSHISASSLARAMLTARKVFSWILASLGDHRARDGHDGLDDLAEQQLGAAQALVGDARDDLWRVAHRPLAAARVDALGGVAEEELLADGAPAAREDRQHDLLRRAGVRRRLQDDERPVVAQVPRGRLGRGDDEREVGRARLGQRRGDADRDRVQVGQRRVVGRRGEAARDRRVALRGHVDQVRAALAHGLHALVAEIDPGAPGSPARRTRAPAEAPRSRARSRRCALRAWRSARRRSTELWRHRSRSREASRGSRRSRAR